MPRGRVERIRWISTRHDPGIFDPYREDGKTFVRLVWGGPFYRPISWPSKRNPWSEWRWATLRIPWVIFPFLSLTFLGRACYIGVKAYGIDETHTYARPEDRRPNAQGGKPALTWSLKVSKGSAGVR